MADDADCFAVLKRQLADDGYLLETGWVAFRLIFLKSGRQPETLKLARLAYMTGAHHLFMSMLQMLDESGADPSAADLARMNLINAELRVFAQEMELRLATPAGKS